MKKNILHTVIIGLLKPIVALCLRNGIKIQTASLLLKSAFLMLAKEELKKNKEKESTSKLAIITGLQRRDVTKLNEMNVETLESSSLLAKVIYHWQKDKKFSTNQKAKDLSYEGSNSQFADLVSSVSKDLNPYTVLFELERLKAVVKNSTTVTLTADVFLPKLDIENSLELMVRDSEDFLEGVQENIFDRKEIPNLHITTRFDNLTVNSIEKLKKWIIKKGAELHASAREEFSSCDKDLNPILFDKKGGVKVVFGSFSRIIKPKKEEEKK